MLNVQYPAHNLSNESQFQRNFNQNNDENNYLINQNNKQNNQIKFINNENNHITKEPRLSPVEFKSMDDFPLWIYANNSFHAELPSQKSFENLNNESTKLGTSFIKQSSDSSIDLINRLPTDRTFTPSTTFIENNLFPNDDSIYLSKNLTSINNSPILKAMKTFESKDSFDTLVELDLSVDERNAYRSLLERSMNRKFILFKEFLKEKDRHFISVLKREKAKIYSLRRQISSMTLLQEKREACVDDVFHLAKLFKMSPFEIHRLYTAAMYFYGSDKYWFEKLLTQENMNFNHSLLELNEKREKEMKSGNNQSGDVQDSNSFEDIPRSHKDAEEYLASLAAHPIIRQIRQERKHILQQIQDLVESNNSFQNEKDLLSSKNMFKRLKKDTQNEFKEQLDEISQQLRASNSILFEQLEDSGRETYSVEVQANIDIEDLDKNKYSVLRDENIDNLLYTEIEKRKENGQKSVNEMETELLDFRISLKKILTLYNSQKNQFDKEKLEMNTLLDLFNKKEKSLIQKMEYIDNRIKKIPSNSFEYNEALIEKRSLENELDKERVQREVVMSRYERSTNILKKKVDELELQKQLQEAKTKTLEIQLGYYKMNENLVNSNVNLLGRINIMCLEIDNASELWNKCPEAMKKSCSIYTEIIQYLVTKSNGYIIQTKGDSFICCWKKTINAINCALALQIKLQEADWPSDLLNEEETKEIRDNFGKIMFRGFRIRIGLHLGQPLTRIDPLSDQLEYYGAVKERLDLVFSYAKGGQIAISNELWVEMKPSIKLLKYKIRFTESEESDIQNKGIIFILPESLSNRSWNMQSPIERELLKLKKSNEMIQDQFTDLQSNIINLQISLREKESIIKEKDKIIIEHSNIIEKKNEELKNSEIKFKDVLNELQKQNWASKTIQMNESVLDWEQEKQDYEIRFKKLESQLMKYESILNNQGLELSNPDNIQNQFDNNIFYLSDPSSSDIINRESKNLLIQQNLELLSNHEIEKLKNQKNELERKCDLYQQKYYLLLEKYHKNKLNSDSLIVNDSNHRLDRIQPLSPLSNHQTSVKSIPLTSKSIRKLPFSPKSITSKGNEVLPLYSTPKKHLKLLENSISASQVVKSSLIYTNSSEKKLPIISSDIKQ